MSSMSESESAGDASCEMHEPVRDAEGMFKESGVERSMALMLELVPWMSDVDDSSPLVFFFLSRRVSFPIAVVLMGCIESICRDGRGMWEWCSRIQGYAQRNGVLARGRGTRRGWSGTLDGECAWCVRMFSRFKSSLFSIYGEDRVGSGLVRWTCKRKRTNERVCVCVQLMRERERECRQKQKKEEEAKVKDARWETGR